MDPEELGWGDSVQASQAARPCAFMSDAFSKTLLGSAPLRTPSHIWPWQPGGLAKSAL